MFDYLPQHWQVFAGESKSIASNRASFAARIGARSFESKYLFISSTSRSFSRFGRFRNPRKTVVMFSSIYYLRFPTKMFDTNPAPIFKSNTVCIK